MIKMDVGFLSSLFHPFKVILELMDGHSNRLSGYITRFRRLCVTSRYHMLNKKSNDWLQKAPERYYPFFPARGIMNIREPIEEPHWLDLDRTYVSTLEIKKYLLKDREDVVIGTKLDTLSAKNQADRNRNENLLMRAREEALEVVVEDLKRNFSNTIKTTRDEKGKLLTLQNLVTNRYYKLDRNDSNLLKIACEQIQEDIVLLLPKDRTQESSSRSESTKETTVSASGTNTRIAYILVDGVLCFADRWRLNDKLGMTMHGIHQPVQHYSDHISLAVDSFLQKLTPEDKVRIRYNYTFQHGGNLHFDEDDEMHDRWIAAEGNYEADDDRRDIYLRVERQGLRKLPCGAVLFSIRTYITPISDMSEGLRKDLNDVFDGKVRSTLGHHHMVHWASLVRAHWGRN